MGSGASLRVRPGFYAAKGARELDFGQQSDADARELNALLKAARWVRDITNGCPEEIYPMSLAESALLLIRGLAGDQVTARITAGEALRESGHIGIWSVGRGSEREPVLLELDYNPTGERNAPVVAALVGKGITFDSGGYSMKSSDNMLPMKSDMGGAAMVTGALALAISRGLNQRVKLILCCAENWSPATPSSWATSLPIKTASRSRSRTPMRKVVWCWPMA